MINDEALMQTKSLSTQLSLTTNQRNSGCLVIAGNTGNVVCNTSFTDLSDSRVKTEIAKADVAELLQLFDSVEAKQYKRPDMNEDLRLGFASRNKVEEFDGDHAVERRHGVSPHQRALGSVQGLPGPAGRGGSLAGPGAEEQVGVSRPPRIRGTLLKPLFGATSRCLQASLHPGTLEQAPFWGNKVVF